MSRTVLVTGASGLLGRQVQRVFDLAGWKVIGTGLNRISPPEVIKLDILSANQIEKVLDEVKPDAVVHCAANRFPDSCTRDPSAAQALNVDASRALALVTIKRGIFLIYISTDYVFSGHPGSAPYTPSSTPDPPNVYGQTKLDGENAVLDVASKAGVQGINRVVVLRVPILYGSAHEPSESAVNVLMRHLWASQQIHEAALRIKIDNYALRYPTNTADVGRVCKDICTLYLNLNFNSQSSEVAKELPKILHFSSEDCMTKWDIVKTFSEIMGLPVDGMVAYEPTEEQKEGRDGVRRPFDCHLDTGELKRLGIDVSTTDFRMWWRREVGAFRH